MKTPVTIKGIQHGTTDALYVYIRFISGALLKKYQFQNKCSFIALVIKKMKKSDVSF